MKPKWAIEPYYPKAYLTAYNFDPVIKESLNCLNELHKTKTLCDHKEEMKLVIGWLKDHYYGRELPAQTDTKKLPSVLNKFKTYLKGGENNG